MVKTIGFKRLDKNRVDKNREENMFIPDSSQLKGLSYQVAECYGKPHFKASYKSSSVKSHKMNEGAYCVMCGMPATNVHHCPPLSKKNFVLETENGSFELKPALFSVCGSGTTGCHNDFHGGSRYSVEWIWEDDRFSELWWSGSLLKKIEPHDRALFLLGHWEIKDKATGRIRKVYR